VEGGAIFNGYFSVDNDTNLITAFYYENNFQENILGPINSNTPYWANGNYLFPNTSPYMFSEEGVNITKFPYYYNQGDTSQYYNLGLNSQVWLSSQYQGGPDPNPLYQSVIMNFAQISGPPSPVPCFKEDIKILTNKGYIPVQDLRKGDLVKTLNHDFKRIDMIGKREIYHPALKERIKDQLYKCSQSEYTEIFEPLIITGCHSILVDNFISEEQKQKVIEVNGKIYVTDNKYRLPACADPRTYVYETPGTYTIYHLALENDNYYMNYGIYANGLLVETCSKRYLKELSNMTLIK
jgi:Hint domain